MSWSVLLSACPQCSEPVTFGGGITIAYGLPRRGGVRVEVAALLPEADTSGLDDDGIVAIGHFGHGEPLF